jgi:hypothetical protein
MSSQPHFGQSKPPGWGGLPLTRTNKPGRADRGNSRKAAGHNKAATAAPTAPARDAAPDPVPPLLVIYGARDQLISPEMAKLFDRSPGVRALS